MKIGCTIQGKTRYKPSLISSKITAHTIHLLWMLPSIVDSHHWTQWCRLDRNLNQVDKCQDLHSSMLVFNFSLPRNWILYNLLLQHRFRLAQLLLSWTMTIREAVEVCKNLLQSNNKDLQETLSMITISKLIWWGQLHRQRLRLLTCCSPFRQFKTMMSKSMSSNSRSRTIKTKKWEQVWAIWQTNSLWMHSVLLATKPQHNFTTLTAIWIQLQETMK